MRFDVFVRPAVMTLCALVLKSCGPNVTVTRDIQFASVIDEDAKEIDLFLDVYSPPGGTPIGRPAILLFHGGSLKSGNKTQMQSVATLYAERGHVVVSANYRLSKDPLKDLPRTLRDAIDDAHEAFDWVVKNGARYQIDPNGIAVGGYSSGGGIATRMTYERAAQKEQTPAALICMMGFPTSDQLPKATTRFPPAVLFVGTKDRLFSWGEKLATALRTDGVSTSFYPLEGKGHALPDSQDEIVRLSSEFVRSVVDAATVE